MDVIVPVDMESRFVSTNIPADDIAEYNPDATYVTGSVVKVDVLHAIYQCLSDAVVDKDDTKKSYPVKGYYPPDYLSSSNALYPWLRIGSDNRFAAIDPYINTQSSRAGSIIYNFVPGGCDSLGVMNCESTSINATLFDDLGNVFWHDEITTYTPVKSLEDLFFSDPKFKTNVFFKFPLGIGGILQIEIVNTIGNAKAGVISMGRIRHIGETSNDVQVAITDYSKYDTNPVGLTTLKKGLSSDLHKFSIIISKSDFSFIKNIITSIRATLCVWIVDNSDPNDAEPALITLGWYTDYKQYRRNALDTIDITIGGSV